MRGTHPTPHPTPSLHAAHVLPMHRSRPPRRTDRSPAEAQPPRPPPLAEPRVSVSEHGPAIMGASDVLSRSMSVLAVWALVNSQGGTDFAGYEAAGVVSVHSGKPARGGADVVRCPALPDPCLVPAHACHGGTQTCWPAPMPGKRAHTLQVCTTPAPQVLLVVAVWFVMWLLQRRPLPPHFTHYRLCLHGQLSTLLCLRR